MKIRDWYFQGWERRTDAAGKSTMVYTGETYTFPRGLRKERLFCLLLSAALLGVYAAVSLRPSAGGMWRPAAIPQLLEIIPLVYLLMGLVRLLTVREPLTYRDLHASWRRLGSAAAASAVLTGCMVLLELVYLILYAREGVGAELLFLLGELLCLGLSLSLAIHIKKHPCAGTVSGAEKE